MLHGIVKKLQITKLRALSMIIYHSETVIRLKTITFCFYVIALPAL